MPAAQALNLEGLEGRSTGGGASAADGAAQKRHKGEEGSAPAAAPEAAEGTGRVDAAASAGGRAEARFFSGDWGKLSALMPAGVYDVVLTSDSIYSIPSQVRTESVPSHLIPRSSCPRTLSCICPPRAVTCSVATNAESMRFPAAAPARAHPPLPRKAWRRGPRGCKDVLFRGRRGDTRARSAGAHHAQALPHSTTRQTEDLGAAGATVTRADRSFCVSCRLRRKET